LAAAALLQTQTALLPTGDWSGESICVGEVGADRVNSTIAETPKGEFLTELKKVAPSP